MVGCTGHTDRPCAPYVHRLSYPETRLSNLLSSVIGRPRPRPRRRARPLPCFFDQKDPCFSIQPQPAATTFRDPSPASRNTCTLPLTQPSARSWRFQVLLVLLCKDGLGSGLSISRLLGGQILAVILHLQYPCVGESKLSNDECMEMREK